MRKIKSQKGITLIALIITIIVLLILAVVAISAVQDDGIINYAKNARGDYGQAQVNENTTLQNYLDKIKENVPTGTSGNNDEDGTEITFKIERQEYKAEKGMTWREWIASKIYDSGDYAVIDIGDSTIVGRVDDMGDAQAVSYERKRPLVSVDDPIENKHQYYCE